MGDHNTEAGSELGFFSSGENMVVLTGREVAKHVEIGDKEQVQPAGVDLTVRAVYRIEGRGALMKNEIALPFLTRIEPVEMEGKSLYHLNTGSYLIRFNEVVRVPKDCIGLILPRSSLMRMGADTVGAVWEPGYEGRGVCLLVVHNPMGIVVEQGARIAQLILIRTSSETEGYRGRYMGEGMENEESRSA